MRDERGCQYVGCEDVAEDPVRVPGYPYPHNVVLCPNHASYVRRALVAESGLDLEVAEGSDAGERTRVWVRGGTRDRA